MADLENHPNAWIAAGLLLESTDQPEQSAAAYAKALDLYAAESEALQGLSRCLLMLEDKQAAQDAAERLSASAMVRERLKILSANPSDQDTMLKLSEDLIRLERYHESLAWLALGMQGRPAESAYASRLKDLQNKIANQPADLGKLWPSVAARVSKLIPLAELGKLGSVDDTSQATVNAQLSGKILFREIGADVGATFAYDLGQRQGEGLNLYQTNGGGVGVIDYDLDGWPDLYLPQAAGRPLEPAQNRINALYRNVQGKQAIDSYEKAGIINQSWAKALLLVITTQMDFRPPYRRYR